MDGYTRGRAPTMMCDKVLRQSQRSTILNFECPSAGGWEKSPLKICGSTEIKARDGDTETTSIRNKHRCIDCN
jgi:hypothetical protein